jgi:hypothetical protein
MTSHAHAPAKADPTAGDSKSRGEAAPANPLWSRLTLGSGAVVQPKLRLGAVDDPAEREADRVAEAVVQRKEGGRDTVGAGLRPALGGGVGPSIGGVTGEGGSQTRPYLDVSPTTESRIGSLRGGGLPLTRTQRTYFEPHFGDLSAVRLHTGPNAQEAARSVSARAFTVGRDIAFEAGEYQMGSAEGRRLLAHELTHTVQQGANAADAKLKLQRQSMTTPDPGASEPEALSTSATSLPTADQLTERLGVARADGGRAIGSAVEGEFARLGVPEGGYAEAGEELSPYETSGRPRLWTMFGRPLRTRRGTRRMESYLQRAALVYPDLALVLALTSRESTESWSGGSGRPTDSVETDRQRTLGRLVRPSRVPAAARTGRWELRHVAEWDDPGSTRVESGPAAALVIPSRDRLVAYAAALAECERRVRQHFDRHPQGAVLLAQLSADARRAWVQYFYAQSSGASLAGLTETLESESEGQGGTLDLNDILTSTAAGENVHVRHARLRAAYAATIDRLLLSNPLVLPSGAGSDTPAEVEVP